jgi:peptidoglycan-associated lipoprotein
MSLKVISAVAALLFVAACATAPEGSGSATGTGGAASTSSGAQTQAAPVSRPSGVQMGTQADLVANVGDRVFFDFDKYDIKPQARTTLDKQAAWLKKFPQVRVMVEGHCDERGTREYNLALGQRRASAVRDYLVAVGVAADRIETVSYGKERPEALGSNEAAWAQNRRGVTVVR